MNSLLLTKQPKCESPRFRDHVCSFGCAYEPFNEGSPCEGETEFHHWPSVAQGGDDTRGMGLCHKHHSMFHAFDEALRSFILLHGETLSRLYLGSWLNLIELTNGAAPEPKRQQRAKKLPGTRPLSKTVNKF